MIELSIDVKIGSEWVEKVTTRRLAVQSFEFWKPEVPPPPHLMRSHFGVVTLFDDLGVIRARVPEDVGRFVPMPERDQRWERRDSRHEVVVPRFVVDGRVEYVDESTGARGSKMIGAFIAEYVCISTREMTHARLGHRATPAIGDAGGPGGESEPETELRKLRLTRHEVVVPYKPFECADCKVALPAYEAAVFQLTRRSEGSNTVRFTPLCLACGAKAAVARDTQIRAHRERRRAERREAQT